ncbi:MAG: hypothetical protein LBJ69_01480 [Holosporales bacterium]|jgi:hypothetical protein|nr:hypothetical protein [Holosporales bacterium]
MKILKATFAMVMVTMVCQGAKIAEHPGVPPSSGTTSMLALGSASATSQGTPSEQLTTTDTRFGDAGEQTRTWNADDVLVRATTGFLCKTVNTVMDESLANWCRKGIGVDRPRMNAEQIKGDIETGLGRVRAEPERRQGSASDDDVAGLMLSAYGLADRSTLEWISSGIRPRLNSSHHLHSLPEIPSEIIAKAPRDLDYGLEETYITEFEQMGRGREEVQA